MSPQWHIERDTRATRATAWLLAIVVATLASAPWTLPSGAVAVLVDFFTFLALAQLWNLLAGYAGIVSLGQHAYLGLGGYALFALTMLLGVPPIAALFLC
jgi:branched-chain amino acid transport system permease protein